LQRAANWRSRINRQEAGDYRAENFQREIGDGACGDLGTEFIQFLTGYHPALFQFHPFAGREFLWYSFQLLLAPTAANCAISAANDDFGPNCQLMLGKRMASSEVASSNPASRKLMRPGRTTATQWSTAPLPYPCGGFGGTLGDGLIGEDADPDLALRFIKRTSARRRLSI